MMDVRQRARNAEPIPELCFGDVEAAQETPDPELEEILRIVGV
jgi:hypothetical protein